MSELYASSDAEAGNIELAGASPVRGDEEESIPSRQRSSTVGSLQEHNEDANLKRHPHRKRQTTDTTMIISNRTSKNEFFSAPFDDTGHSTDLELAVDSVQGDGDDSSSSLQRSSTIESMQERNEGNEPKKHSHRKRQMTDRTMIMSNRASNNEFFSPFDTEHPTETTVDKTPSSCHELPEEPRSQSCGRGIVDDYKKTIGTYWWEEIINLKSKTIAVILFLFFACVAPAITFGAIYSKITNNWIGPVEMLVGTAWCGIFFALVGGQPTMVNGGTGPVLAFSG
jgi:hypothetical protein